MTSINVSGENQCMPGEERGKKAAAKAGMAAMAAWRNQSGSVWPGVVTWPGINENETPKWHQS